MSKWGILSEWIVVLSNFVLLVNFDKFFQKSLSFQGKNSRADEIVCLGG